MQFLTHGVWSDEFAFAFMHGQQRNLRREETSSKRRVVDNDEGNVSCTVMLVPGVYPRLLITHTGYLGSVEQLTTKHLERLAADDTALR